VGYMLWGSTTTRGGGIVRRSERCGGGTRIGSATDALLVRTTRTGCISRYKPTK